MAIEATGYSVDKRLYLPGVDGAPAGCLYIVIKLKSFYNLCVLLSLREHFLDKNGLNGTISLFKYLYFLKLWYHFLALFNLEGTCP